jgi:hypothetical protein
MYYLSIAEVKRLKLTLDRERESFLPNSSILELPQRIKLLSIGASLLDFSYLFGDER